MKGFLVAVALLVAPLALAKGSKGGGDGTGSNPKHEHVDGYTKKDGTYVPPHERSKANDTKNDNYGTKGNTNPYNGEEGKKKGDDPAGDGK